MTRTLVVAGLLAITSFSAPSSPPLSAQRASLDRVEELTRLGRPEEARALLLEWWEDARDRASRQELQRGLWLRGRLTVDPVQAELDYQRLVVLYPRGRYTPEAILRLAQVAHARGDADAARAHVATLVRDFARSPVREDAEAWLRGAGPAPPPPTGVTVEREPVSPEPSPADSARRGGGDPPTRDEPSTALGTYFVQLGAFAEEERALALYEEVRASGVQVRVVRVEGSGFLHVRFGRFVERQDAVDALERLTEAGIRAALVRDERPETLVRG